MHVSFFNVHCPASITPQDTISTAASSPFLESPNLLLSNSVFQTIGKFNITLKLPLLKRVPLLELPTRGLATLINSYKSSLFRYINIHSLTMFGGYKCTLRKIYLVMKS